MATIWQLTRAVGLTLRSQMFDVIASLAGRVLQNQAREFIPPTRSRWLSINLLSQRSIDGAVLGGLVPEDAYAKYTLPKGLPGPGQKVLAIENDPHSVDDFDGVIDRGYGKGVKTLLVSDTGIVKVGARSWPARFNLHFHDADVAGPHYDLVAEGVDPGTSQWELHVPRGAFRGRYAFVSTQRGMMCVAMKDRSILLPKPDYTLKDEAFLASLDPAQFVIEQKYDGSLANISIHDNRAVFRSHRENAQAYYDKIPQLEYLGNKSPFVGFRLLAPGPDQEGTVFKGEIVHPDGTGRVSGILNALPVRAQEIQQLRGPAELFVWNIVKLRGRDVSKLPYEKRRALYEEAVRDIQRFNPYWHTVRKLSMEEGENPLGFYQEIIQEPLPYGEGVVVKRKDDPEGRVWYKVKDRDLADLEVIDILEGQGKYAGTVGKLVVRDPDTGGIGEVGSLSVPDSERQWIWDHRTELLAHRPGNDGRAGSGRIGRLRVLPEVTGPVAKIRVQEMTSTGVPRAGVFVEWHPDPRKGGPGSERALQMYAESLAGGDPEEAQRMLYRLKSAAGWKRN